MRLVKNNSIKLLITRQTRMIRPRQNKKPSQSIPGMRLLRLMCPGILVLMLFVGCGSKNTADYTEMINDSQTLIDNSDFDNALIKVDEAIKLDSEAPEAYVQKAFIHVAKGEYNQARDALKFVRLHLDDFKQEDSLYAALLNLGNFDYMEGSSQTALDYFQQALKIDDSDPTLLNAIGLIYIDLQEYDKAKEYYLRVIEMDTKNYYAYANLATIFLKEEDFERGLNEINTALSLNAKVPQFYIIKGELQSALNKTDEAIVTYSELIASFSDFGDAYFKRGDLYLSQGDYLKAVSDFSFAKELGIVEGYMGMGYAYSGLKQYEDAINAFNALQANSEGVDLRVLYEVAVASYQLERYEDAIASIDQLIKIEETDVEALLLKAYCLERLGNYDDAYLVLEHILTIDETNEKAKTEMDFISENQLR